MHRFDEAFAVLDDGINKKLAPVGNLLYEKADLMHTLLSSRVRTYNYTEINSYFERALKSKNTVLPTIYLGLGEMAVLMGNLDKAMEYLHKGSALNEKISRFYMLGAIVETKKKNYRQAYKYLEGAIEMGEKEYLLFPDTVLAMATILCHFKRNDLAKIAVDQATALIKESDELPDLISARKVVDECINK